MFLDSNRKLVGVLTAAATTLNLPVSGDYVDITATTTTPNPFNTFTDGVTAIDILAAPAASTLRKVNGLEIYNRDTAAKTLRIYEVDATPTTGLITAGAFVVGNDYQIVSVGTTNFTLIGASANTAGVIFTATGVGTGTGTASTCYQKQDVTLQIDDVLGYTDTGGWYVTDGNGNRKTIAGTNPASCFSVYLPTTAQTITSGVWTKVTLSAKNFDTNTFFDATTNYRFQPTISGYYAIQWAIDCIATGTTITQAFSGLYKDGSLAYVGDLLTGLTITRILSNGSAIVFLNGSTDYVELFGYIVGTTPQFNFGNTFLTGSFVRSA